MQIILTTSVRKLGKLGETVNVKDGFGRNFLLPNKLAIRATQKNIEQFKTKQKDLESKNIELKEKAEIIAKTIGSKNLIFISQTAADGRLFGSVSSKLIAAHINEQADISLNYSNILLDEPIKFTGAYKVNVAYHSEVIVAANIIVARSDSEAQDIINESKKDKSEADGSDADKSDTKAASADESDADKSDTKAASADESDLNESGK